MTTIEELFGARTATVVADAISAPAATELRDRLARGGYQRYALVDRGSYEHADVDDAALFATLVELARKTTGRTLAVTSARALRLSPGDYLLAHHDQVHADHPLELVLDVSPAVVPGAEVHYRRRGQVFFRAPSAPGSAALVERGPTVTCNHTYVSRRSPDASVVRVVALLR